MSSFVKDFEDFCQDSEEAQETMRKLRKIIKEQKSKKIQEKKAEEDKQKKSEEDLRKEYREKEIELCDISRTLEQTKNEITLYDSFITLESSRISNETKTELSDILTSLRKDKEDMTARIEQIRNELKDIVRKLYKTSTEVYETPYGTVSILSKLLSL